MKTTAPKKSHSQMVNDWKKDPAFLATYNELEMEYTLLTELLEARRQAGMTQADVAERMGTKAPAITRLEAALSDSRHSPTLATLKKYAQAVGCKLEVHLVPAKAT